jgi:hypothetical protein
MDKSDESPGAKMNPNSDASKEPDVPAPPNPNAAAIERARIRVRERQLAAERNEARSRRESRGWGLNDGSGIWDNLFVARLVIGGALAGGSLLISSIAWLGENLRWPIYYLLRALDTLTGARSLPVAPWLVWTFWGAIFGGTLGYWLVAPLYSERENRSMILWLPLLGMTTIALLTWCFVPG